MKTMTDMKRAEADIALRQNDATGGTQFIWFRETEVASPIADVREAMEIVRAMSTEARDAYKKVLYHSLDEVYSTVQVYEAPADVAIGFCQDVAIWFAIEILEGRAVLDGGKGSK